MERIFAKDEDEEENQNSVSDSLLNRNQPPAPMEEKVNNEYREADQSETHRFKWLEKRMKSKDARKHCWSCLRTNCLTIATVIGVLGGIILGYILRRSSEKPWNQRQILYMNFIGELFLRMLKTLILPLIVSSLISAVGGLDLSLSGKIGIWAVAYYMATTFMAVVLGIILVVSIHPGGTEGAESIKRAGSSRNVTTADTLMDLVRNMFPPNLVEAAIYQYRTVLIPNNNSTINGTLLGNATISKSNLYDWTITSEFFRGINILGLVVFSVVFGITIGRMKENGKILQDFFSALAEAMMMITSLVIWYWNLAHLQLLTCSIFRLSPVGVLFLIAAQMLKIDDFSMLAGQLGMYFFTVLFGVLMHGLVVLPIFFSIVTRTLPFKFIANMTQALVTAFGTASSSATLPLTISCLEDKNKIDPRVTRFVIPIGATINMDGTALYEAVAAIFIAQVRGISLSLGSIIAISITATAASIGAAGIPQAGLVTMVMVLDTVGLPAEDVTLIIAVDWLLDRFRTTINVLGDSFGAGIVSHITKKALVDYTRRISCFSNRERLYSDWDKVKGDHTPSQEEVTVL